MLPVIEGLGGDAFLPAEGNDTLVGLGKAFQALNPPLTQRGAVTDGEIFGLGHDSSPGDRATPRAYASIRGLITGLRTWSRKS